MARNSRWFLEAEVVNEQWPPLFTPTKKKTKQNTEATKKTTL
jgi:hypothetical protein